MPEILDQLRVELADLGVAERRLEHEIISPAQIERARDKRLVHRQREVAVARDARFVAQGLLECLADRDARVFDGVVIIDMQVAIGFDREVERAVLGEERQHVVKEPNARFDLALAAAVEVERDANLGFAGVALDRSGAGHGGLQIMTR